jgi:hypothetical protein
LAIIILSPSALMRIKMKNTNVAEKLMSEYKEPYRLLISAVKLKCSLIV